MATTEPTTTTTEQVTDTIKPNGEADPMTVDAKESEPITTAPTEKQEPTKQDEAELLVEGTKLLKSEQYDKACNVLSDALRVTQEKGIATNIESVGYYIAYGEALLRYCQSSNDLFGAAVRQSQQQHAQEDGDEEQTTVPADSAVPADPTATAQSNGHSKEEADDDAADPNVPADPQEDAQPESGAGGGDVDTSEDREIAWETFEYARSIMEEYLAADGNENDDVYLNKLATVHSFLGEICLEDERHEAALIEFDSALTLQGKCKEGVVPCRERATNHYWACLAGQCAGQFEVALKHCTTALDCLSDKIQSLCSGFEAEEECKSHGDVISVAEEVLKRLDAAQTESENGKELKSLVGVMTELNETRQEVERIIKKEKEEPVKTDSNAQGLAAMEDMDPLAAMISGLIQQCGIDKEELDKMDKELDQNDQNNGNSNRKEQQGVTTIGFGNQPEEDGDEEVHEVNVLKTKRRKRNMKEAGIGGDAADEVKKMKLSTEDDNVAESAKAEQVQTA